jgi:hypothetical protein
VSESNATVAGAANILIDLEPREVLHLVAEREGRLQSAERAVPTHVSRDTTNLLSA